MKKLTRGFAFAIGAASVSLAGCGGNEFKTKVADTQRSYSFLDSSKTIARLEGFSAVQITQDGRVSGNLRRWARMEVKKAPIVKTDQIKSTSANPVGTALATIFTLGLYPINAPKDAWQGLVGKDEVLSSDETPDYSRAKSTGDYRWQELTEPRQERLSIKVGEKTLVQSFRLDSTMSYGSFNLAIGLKDYIENEVRTTGLNEVIVRIECECSKSGNFSGAPYDALELNARSEIRLTRETHPDLFPAPNKPRPRRQLPTW